MASSTRAEKVIHQDYIARIRYSNTLPPPPNPPRLLDIPNTGLAGGQYTAPGFASRLAREQPLNIEADAELGMPLDLVGMPGIFDGDESSIQAPLHPQPLNAHDRALMRPLATLGKPKFSDTGVSFLRRTEYISAYSSKGTRFDSNSAKTLAGNARAKRARPSIDRESPEYIKAQIAKSFETAASNLRDSSRVVHPFKRGLKVEAAYPVIPDLDAFGDVGGYVEVKFGKHPSLKETYDTRLETSVLRPIPLTKRQAIERQELMELHLMDPAHNPKPPAEDDYDYEFFLAPNAAESENYKRKFDPTDLLHDDDTLYPKTDEQGMGHFDLEHVRIYETVSQVNTSQTKYDEVVVLSIDDGEDSHRQKGAYYYPVVSRVQIDPRRKKNMARKLQNGAAEGDENPKTDIVRVTITDPDEETAKIRAEFALYPTGKPDDVEEAGNDEEEDGDHEPDDEVPSTQMHDGNTVGGSSQG